MKIDDRVLGIGMALLALLVIWQAQTVPSVPGTTFGPSLMPTLVGIVMAGCGMAVLVGGLRQKHDVPMVDVSVWHGHGRGLVCAVWAVLGVVIGVWAMPLLGFPIFGLLYALPLMLLMGARPLIAILVALTVVVCAFFVFSRLLYVPLPVGPLSFLG